MKENNTLHFFVSDVHLGLKSSDPVEREARFIRFLDNLPAETESVYLIGDIFDFWFEYKYVIPKGFTRVLGRLAFLNDKGVKLYFFKGNHDMWTFGYLEKEIGLKVMDEPSVVTIGKRKFCLAHGDYLTDAEPIHNLTQKLFRSKFLQGLLARLHPSWTFSFAHRWSENNRISRGEPISFRGVNDPLYGYACEFEKHEKVDYFIFGHMHTPGSVKTPMGAVMYILGEWIRECDYLCYNEEADEIYWLKGC